MALPIDTSGRVQRILKDGRFLSRLEKPVRIDCKHEIPYVAGYSKNGRTVYFDRDYHPFFNWKGKIIDTRDYILIHEVSEKAIIDLYGLRYQAAHHIATHIEAKVVAEHGINWWSYTRFIHPQIKHIYHEKVRDVPKDLDLTPYIDEDERKVLDALKHRKDIRPYIDKKKRLYRKHRH